MAKELNAEILQAKGNYIRVFKTTEEKNREKIINEEIEQITNIIKDDEVEKVKENSKKFLEFRSMILQGGENLESRTLNPSIISESKQEIIDNALKIVGDNLHSQTAAIFIVSKNGILEHVGTYGFEENGDPLDKDWYCEEKYIIGDDSFTGKVINSNTDSSFGEIQYAPTINKNDFTSEFRNRYLQKFRSLQSAIAIPLNGRNRTCGVLRVINKVDKTSSLDIELSAEDLCFSEDDVNLSLFLATNISNALSNFRRDMQAKMLMYLSHLLIQPQPSYQPREYLRNIYQQVLNLLVHNPETSFKACVLRLEDDSSKLLVVEGTSFSYGVTTNRDDKPRQQNHEEFLWITVEGKQRLIIQDIQSVIQELRDKEQPTRFHNEDWIISNNFQSVACFPLLAKGEMLGTLSVYTGYKYDSDSIDFLQSVTDLLCSFVFTIKLEKQKFSIQNMLTPLHRKSQIEETFNALADEWKRDTQFLSSIIQISIHPAYQKIIGLGSEVLPFLFRELDKDDPGHWFWALSAITGENPILPEQRGRLNQMKEAWIEWGKTNNYV
jgi:GAF domain-containing protein